MGRVGPPGGSSPTQAVGECPRTPYGAVRLILAGVVETRADRARYQPTVAVPQSVCLLAVELPVVRSRLARRHADDPAALRWHLDRSTQLHSILTGAELDDFIVDGNAGSAAEVAAEVIRTTGRQ